MIARPRETTGVHTRLSKCALEVEDARAYWAHSDRAPTATARQAFGEYWFGARSLSRVEILLRNMRARFDAFPPALDVLRRWPDMPPDVRRAICHWHLQLADPLYRRFTGSYLPGRRSGHRAEVTRDLVVRWVERQGFGHWTMSMRIQYASKLLSASFSAGLVASNRDPRPVVVPRVADPALEYLFYLLRGVQFEGSLLDNPYTLSAGLEGEALEERLRSLPGLAFKRQGDLLDFDWRYGDLRSWAAARLWPGHVRAGGAE